MKTMLKIVLVLVFAALAAPAAAQVQAIGVHTASWHSNGDVCRADNGGRPCNNTNPGAYLRFAGGWVAGAYHNSINKPTFYVGRSWSIAQRGRASLEVAALAATGYPVADVVPLVTPTAAVRLTERAAVRLSYLPRLGKWNETHVFHLSFEVRR